MTQCSMQDSEVWGGVVKSPVGSSGSPAESIVKNKQTKPSRKLQVREGNDVSPE